MEGIQYIGDSFSTVGDTFSTVEVGQYNGDNISTVGDIISTVEAIQHIGGVFHFDIFDHQRNDKKLSIFFCIAKQNFHLQVSKILTDFMSFKRWTGVLQVQPCF